MGSEQAGEIQEIGLIHEAYRLGFIAGRGFFDRAPGAEVVQRLSELIEPIPQICSQ